ncbi:MAG: TonB-dependent receptor plug domain-containing protein [Myxococcota bacterium]
MILLFGWMAFAGTVRGVALERGTSERLPGLSVTAEWDGASVDTTTDEEGGFTLEAPDGQTVRLLLQDADHIPTRIEVVTPAADLKVFVERAVAGHEIVVESFRSSSHPTVHRVDAEQAYETPGTQDDVVRLTQSLPGVTVQREFSPTSGDLSVRGSAPGDNRYYLDGIEIPYLYHFNQYASVVPTTQLRGLELYPSTFGSKYGDAVGAVVEADSRTDAPEDVQGQITFNTIIGGADVRAPVGKGWWVSASGRRSYQDLYSGSTAQYTVWPVFHDLSVRAEKGDETRGTGVFLVTAGDRYERAAGELDVLDPVEALSSPRFDYRRNFQVMGLRHRWRGDQGDGRWVVGLVRDSLDGTLSSGGQQTQRSLNLSSRLDLSQRLGSSNHTFQGGFEVRSGVTDLDVVPGGDDGILVTTEAPALGRNAVFSGRIPRLEAAGYGEVKLDAGDVEFFPGARVGVDSLTGAALLEPRLAARWQIADQTAVKLAGGRYVQTPALLDLMQSVGNPDLPLTRAWQVSAGWEQTFAQRLELNLDVYGKALTDAQLARPDGAPEVFEEGRAYGAELVTRYRLRERFFLWGWAGIARTQVKRQDKWVPAAFDQPLNLGFVASWDVSNRWNLALRWRYGSGLPWTPVTGGLYNANNDTWSPVLGESFSERFPAYTKLDLVVGRSFVFDRWTLAIRAELWYVPRRANVLYPTWNDDWSEQGWVRGIPFLPLLGGRATF